MEKSHWKLTGDWQDDSYTTKAVRKIHGKSGRKGREMIMSGRTCTTGRWTQKGRGFTKVETLSGE